MKVISTIAAILIAILIPQLCWAWSEGGHHLIAVMAFDELTPADQAAVLDLLRQHPRFREDFKVPEKVRNAEHWLIGRAAFWPDLIRRSSYDRPKWHYDIAFSGGDLDAYIGGDSKSETIPLSPYLPPDGATLNTKELNIKQSIRLCRQILADKTQSGEERAIALCWICHLVGDAHQPCHGGSYYTKHLFPKGDRGGNSVPTKQGKNLHALWDGLLGPKFDEGDVARRKIQIRQDENLWNEAKEGTHPDRGCQPESWLSESSSLLDSVYSPEIEAAIKDADEAGKMLEPIKLSEEYLKRAGETARRQAARAAITLAQVLCRDVGTSSK